MAQSLTHVTTVERYSTLFLIVHHTVAIPQEFVSSFSSKSVTVVRLDVPRGAVFQVVDYSTPRTFLMTGLITATV